MRKRLIVLSLLLIAIFTIPAYAGSHSMTTTSLEMKVGTKKTLKIPGAKAKKVKWKSSKPSVVKVSKTGKLTAKKTGKATITAKYKGLKFKCKVKVYKKKKATTKATEAAAEEVEAEAEEEAVENSDDDTITLPKYKRAVLFNKSNVRITFTGFTEYSELKLYVENNNNGTIDVYPRYLVVGGNYFESWNDFEFPAKTKANVTISGSGSFTSKEFNASTMTGKIHVYNNQKIDDEDYYGEDGYFNDVKIR